MEDFERKIQFENNKQEHQLAEKLKRPSMYSVMLLNDDYTPMDFVVLLLESYFYKSHEDAMKIMMDTHQKGQGCCGTFTKDVAETKMTQVVEEAKRNNYPLKCTLRKE